MTNSRAEVDAVVASVMKKKKLKITKPPEGFIGW